MSIVTTVSSRGPVAQRARHLDRIAELLGDRVGECVAMQPHEWCTPEVLRLEHVLGLYAHQEPFVLVDLVAGSRPAREGARRRPVDPTDCRPEPAFADDLQEAELKVDAVDAAA